MPTTFTRYNGYGSWALERTKPHFRTARCPITGTLTYTRATIDDSPFVPPKDATATNTGFVARYKAAVLLHMLKQPSSASVSAPVSAPASSPPSSPSGPVPGTEDEEDLIDLTDYPATATTTTMPSSALRVFSDPGASVPASPWSPPPSEGLSEAFMEGDEEGREACSEGEESDGLESEEDLDGSLEFRRLARPFWGTQYDVSSDGNERWVEEEEEEEEEEEVEEEVKEEVEEEVGEGVEEGIGWAEYKEEGEGGEEFSIPIDPNDYFDPPQPSDCTLPCNYIPSGVSPTERAVEERLWKEWKEGKKEQWDWAFRRSQRPKQEVVQALGAWQV